jgi:hypothetical protein
MIPFFVLDLWRGYIPTLLRGKNRRFDPEVAPKIPKAPG